MSTTRLRLTPEESRAAALEAARELLLESGPQAVTLKAVGARIGKTHANLLHHFGTAAGLQSELARFIAERVTTHIAAAVERARHGEADPREVVDLGFGDGINGAVTRLRRPRRRGRREGDGGAGIGCGGHLR